jgi:glycosyltransferase involved in cell wall biosynthesis
MSATTTILQVLPRLDSGGVERGTIDIAEAIAKQGWKSLVASAGGQLLPHIHHVGGEHITLPLHSKNPLVIRKNIASLYDLITSRNVSLIHARSRAPAWAAYYAAKKAGIPFVTTFHGIYSQHSWFKKHYNSVMVKGRRVIAVSEFVRQHILANYDIAPEHITLIHRGVDFKTFDPEKPIADRFIKLNREWRIPEEPRKIIFCPGRISRIKGQHVLLHALAQLKDIPFLCVFAGKEDGHEDYRAELDALIIQLGLEGLVRIVPATQYMNEAYLLADVVVVPSLQPESFGRIAIEAQAMGKLVVATDHGGARETIIPNETGYLVPPEDAGAMAQAIHYGLTRDGDTMQAMRDYAMQHVRDHFSVTRMKQATLNVYHDVLNHA